MLTKRLFAKWNGERRKRQAQRPTDWLIDTDVTQTPGACGAITHHALEGLAAAGEHTLSLKNGVLARTSLDPCKNGTDIRYERGVYR